MSRRSWRAQPDAGQILQRAVQHHQTGQLDVAERLYWDVLKMVPEQPDALHLLGVLAIQHGRPADAVLRIRRAVASRPASAVYHANLGVALQAVGRLDDARAALERAVSLDAGHVDASFNLGVTLQTLGALDDAVTRYRHVITLAPGHVGALRNLGNSLASLGRHEEAVDAFRQVLALAPGDTGLLGSLGASLAGLGRTDDAIEALTAATISAPNDPDAWLNLGVACHPAGRTDQAIDAYRRSLVLRPTHAETWHSLGRAFVVARKSDEGIACYRRALVELPAVEGPANGHQHAASAATTTRVRVLCDLGAALHGEKQTSAAIEQFRAAVALGPEDSEAWYGLGAALSAIGALEESADALGRAVELGATSPDTHSKQIFVLDLLPTTTLEQAYTARRAWNELHARPLEALSRPHINRPDPERRLRVGYVSADFYRHSAALPLLTILEAHDSATVEIVCYAANPREDDYTARFRARAAIWRPMIDLSDEALAEQIRADEIDILVDLSAHSGGNRLLTFARKPAPVQVTAWGYATGTGLDAIDAFFADPIVVPPDEQRWYAEEVVYLSGVLPLAAPYALPPVTPLPALSRGHVTFGSYNRPIKITTAVLETWARILLAVPDSRLLLKPGRQDSDATRERLLEPLVRLGVDPTRVEMVPLSAHDEHLVSFGQVDIQLDPFPQGGGITTAEGLLMAVPCVTLLGARLPGRVSASMLSAAGLDDLVAHGVEEYVEIAVRLAGNLDRLAHERATLRERLLASPTGNAALYTRAVEDAYRVLWRRWCASEGRGVREEGREAHTAGAQAVRPSGEPVSSVAEMAE
jgi:protein O-GlcNAc transferase